VPFTLAHPAAVLPLRRWLWFPGLVALLLVGRLLLPSLMALAPGRAD
jgi:hypothetical protein